MRKEKITVTKIILESGWNICVCIADNLLKFYICETWLIIREGEYDFYMFSDFTCELPIWCFRDWEAAVYFAKTHSNRHPYEVQQWYLRFQKEYWFATVLADYLDEIRWLSSQQRIDRIRHVLQKYP